MPADSANNIQIKGIREGLLVTTGEGDWQQIQAALIAQVDEKKGFFQGAKLALDVGNAILHAAELGALRDALSDRGISLWAVIGNSPLTAQNSQALGLATRLSTPRPERAIHSLDTQLSGESAVLVQRTLRSGFKINYAGHVVVIGDVNPGAEIVAGGSVVVWGRLRGAVHAGAEGNESAVICALNMDATQIRIAGSTAVLPSRKGKPQPEMACIKNEQVNFQPWVAKDK